MKHLILAGLLGIALFAGAEPRIQIIPQPSEITVKEGSWTLPSDVVVSFDPQAAGAREAAEFFAGFIRPATGYPLTVAPVSAKQKSAIVFAAPVADEKYPTEGYGVTVTPSGVTVTASDAAGFFYGAQTLCQLLPPQVFAAKKQEGVNWIMPCCTIKDAPRFSWRGWLLDDARYFFGKEAAKRYLDLMAMYKYNVFHWHLVDDQGWRLTVDAFPKLIEIGSVRAATQKRFNRSQWDGKPYGPFFYTKDDIKEVIAYAAKRHIRVMPEIELPGHARAALAAYPELSCVPGYNLGTSTEWKVHEDVFCAGNDQTLRFFEQVFDEVCELFDNPVIHIGGDECPKVRWKECPKCQARIKALGLKDEHELQSWLVGHFTQYLAKKGRRALGWDEILEGGLPKGTMVMSWRGVAGGIAAAKKGHDVVMTPTDYCYVDYHQFKVFDGYEYHYWDLPLEKAYSFNPCAGIPSEQQHHILGTQANNWGEFIADVPELEWKSFPRSCALAEVAWSPQESRKFSEFKPRLATHLTRLKHLGVNSAPMAMSSNPPAVATWKKGDFSAEWSPASWDITSAVKKPGKYLVVFSNTDGEGQLRIKNLKVLADDQVIEVNTPEQEVIPLPVFGYLPFTISGEVPPKLRLEGEVRAKTESAGEIAVVALD